MSKSIIALALSEEADRLNAIKKALITGDVITFVKTKLTAKQTNRATVAEESMGTLQNDLGDDKKRLKDFAYDAKAEHETQRVLRDRKISRLNHKQLLIACLNTASAFADALEYKVEEELEG